MEFINSKLKHILFAFLAILAISSVSCTDKKTDATDYNNKIVELQSSIIQKMLDLASSFESGSTPEMTNKHRELINTCEEIIRQSRELEPFEENSELRDTAIKLFEFYLSISTNEYREIIDILGKENTPYNMQRMQEVVEDISIRESALDNEFMMAQKAFVEKYGIQIIDNPLQKDVDSL